MKTEKKRQGRILRKVRVRKKVNGTAERPRLSVYKSLKHICAQVIDDTSGKILVSASTMDKTFREKMKPAKNMKAFEQIGELIGDKAAAAGISKLVFDRNGYRYHGKIAKIAEKVREKGIVV